MKNAYICLYYTISYITISVFFLQNFQNQDILSDLSFFPPPLKIKFEMAIKHYDNNYPQERHLYGGRRTKIFLMWILLQLHFSLFSFSGQCVHKHINKIPIPPAPLADVNKRANMRSMWRSKPGHNGATSAECRDTSASREYRGVRYGDVVTQSRHLCYVGTGV